MISVYDLHRMVKRPTKEEDLLQRAFSTGMSPTEFSDESVASLKRAFGFDPDAVSMMLRGKIFMVVPKGQTSGPMLELDVDCDGDRWATIPWG